MRRGLEVGRGILGAAFLTAAGLGGLGGCNATPRDARNAIVLYNVGDYPQAEAALKPDITKKNENFVLNNCRFGSCALAAGDLAGAENAFMAAYEVINGVNTNDGGRTLGATVVFEGIKVWKGQPFERAMAHYYLGLVYLLQHDYENARAAFQNSLFKLRENTNKDDYDHIKAEESNFALGYFGLGYCYSRLPNKSEQAADCFKHAVAIDPQLGPLVDAVQQPGTNTLLFVDAGQGPRRYPKGWYNEESVFFPTPAEVGPIAPAIAYLDGNPINSPNMKCSLVDTLAMAQQTRWQDMDTLRKAKAVAGTALMAGGTGAMAYGSTQRNQTAEWAGLGAFVAGAALSASSQADLRYWEMLPRAVYVIPLALPPGPHTLVVQAGRSQSGALTVNIPAAGPAAADNIYYFRLR